MTKSDVQIDENKLEVTITRVFNASRERVWDACTDPKQVSRWWGPRHLEMTVEKLEAKVGGTWRILQADSRGNEYWFSGEYREVVKPEKIVRTFIYEAFPGAVLVETSLFETVEGNKTKLITIAQLPSSLALQAMTSSGMEKGMIESFDRLAELAEE